MAGFLNSKPITVSNFGSPKFRGRSDRQTDRQTDQPALTLKEVDLRSRPAGLSVSVHVLSNVDFISQLKAIWLSTNIVIKIRT